MTKSITGGSAMVAAAPVGSFSASPARVTNVGRASHKYTLPAGNRQPPTTLAHIWKYFVAITSFFFPSLRFFLWLVLRIAVPTVLYATDTETQSKPQKHITKSNTNSHNGLLSVVSEYTYTDWKNVIYVPSHHTGFDYYSQLIVLILVDFFCVSNSLILLTARYQRLKMSLAAPQPPFPFMDLPPELRDMVYEYLVEDPHYPPRAPCAKHSGSSLSTPFNLMFPSYQALALGPGHQGKHQCGEKKQSNWIFLANKQCYAEFMSMLVKKGTFHFNVSPRNYPKGIPAQSLPLPLTPQPQQPQPPQASMPTPSPSPPSSPKLTSTPLPPQKLWTISPSTLPHIRHCTITLYTTSTMLGVPDPRTMPPASWSLATQIKSELSALSNIKSLNLHVKAIGDPLWNPLWVWFHASQAFVGMGEGEDGPEEGYVLGDAEGQRKRHTGPRLGRITFSLDTWSPGENHLERLPSPTAEGSQQEVIDSSSSSGWGWFCPEGHCVSDDAGPEQTVREFCARLYTECRVCRPELESDDEDGWGHDNGDDEVDDDDDDDDESVFDEEEVETGGEEVEVAA